jgi:tRNA(fMet)-specific endonuclease VapC
VEVRVLLDTNAYTALFRGDESVAARVRHANQVFISAIVVGELLFGFRNGRHYDANRRDLNEFLASAYVTLLPVTFETCDRFGRIAAALRRKGRPIPSNDIWIAAHAMESGAELLSFDRHFEEVDGILWTQL